MRMHEAPGMLTIAQHYAVGLLTEEMGEAQTAIGEGLRFGFDTVGRRGEAIDQLERELGDVEAAIEYAKWSRLVNRATVERHRDRKIAKLRNPESRDNKGNRLAPHPDEGKAP